MRATYKGKREDGKAVVHVDGAPLPTRNDLRNHSPNGFEWGYLGSGPSQLALAILAHHFHNAGDSRDLADAKAMSLYHAFKEQLIAGLLTESWELDSHVVGDTVSMVVKDSAERFFDQATRLELETGRLNRDLDECYRLLEPS